MDVDPQKVRSVFLEAVEKRSPDRQKAFLDEACADNSTLRRRVEVLLRAHAQSNSLVDNLASNPVAIADGPDISERPGVAVGPYMLLEQIGEGGFGVVFKAEQTQPIRRNVALKVVKPGMDTSQVVARFEAERQALALMDHQNIAQIFDGGATESGRPYFVMELVRGVPIMDFCDSNHLSILERLGLFISVCEAVQHAHQKGIIHRDLKPSNIMVTMLATSPVVKVIDFGIAKATSQQLTDKPLLTNSSQMIGTPMYMSPEQAQLTGLNIDTRTDIYALGVLLYELLTGTTPFDQERLCTATFDEMRRIIREEEPPKPSARLTTLGEAATTASMNRASDPRRLTQLLRGELDWIVMKALEKDRNRRYDTAGAFAADLQRYLKHEAVHACPPTFGYQMRKFILRHKGPVLAASLVLVTLLAGIMGTTAEMIHAERQRVRAEEAEITANAQRDKAVLAADAERVARDSAQKRLTQIEKGNEILGSMFTDLNPRMEEIEAKPLRALLGARLDDAVKQLEGEAVGDPLTVARLQRTLAVSLLGLGYPEKAMPLLGHARETFDELNGRDQVDSLLTALHLGEAHRMARQPEVAVPLLEETLERMRANLGPDHIFTISCRQRLAGGYRDAGRLDDARRTLEETLPLSREKLGRDDIRTLDTMKELAITYRYAGRLDLAITLFGETLSLARGKLGPEHDFTLATMQSFAEAYLSAGKPRLALPMLNETLRIQKEKLGYDHPVTIQTMNAIAAGYLEARDFKASLPLLNETLNLAKQRLGPDHTITLSCTNNLAACYQKTGKLNLALSLFEESLRVHIAKFGPDHRNTLTCMLNLATCHRDMGKLDQALPLFLQAANSIAQQNYEHEFAMRILDNVAECQERLGQIDQAEIWRRRRVELTLKKGDSESTDYAAALTVLGCNLSSQKKWNEAESVLRESLSLCQKNEPDAWSTYFVQSTLGSVFLSQQNYAAAEPYLLQGYEGMREREAMLPKDAKKFLTWALGWLVQLYDAQGKPESAAEWRNNLELEKTRQQKLKSPAAND